jgi:hypothetical protein
VTQRFNVKISPCGWKVVYWALKDKGWSRNSSSEAGVGLRVAEPPDNATWILSRNSEVDTSIVPIGTEQRGHSSVNDYALVPLKLETEFTARTPTPHIYSEKYHFKMDQMMGGGDGGMGGQAGFPLETWFWEMPLCTRWWTTATVLTSALVQCQIVTPFQLFYSVRAVFVKSQVRLIDLLLSQKKQY